MGLSLVEHNLSFQKFNMQIRLIEIEIAFFDIIIDVIVISLELFIMLVGIQAIASKFIHQWINFHFNYLFRKNDSLETHVHLYT